MYLSVYELKIPSFYVQVSLNQNELLKQKLWATLDDCAVIRLCRSLCKRIYHTHRINGCLLIGNLILKGLISTSFLN